MSTLSHKDNSLSQIQLRYWIIISGVLGLGAASLWIEGLSLLLPALGGLLLGVYLLIFYPKIIIGALFFMIPISAEIELPGGLSTDLPGEPLLWALTVLSVVLISAKGIKKNLWHPITVVIILQLLWILVTALFATAPLFSIKFLVAKSWYIIPLFVLPHYLINSTKEIHKLLDYFIAGVSLAAGYFFIKHGLEGFDFDARVTAGKPIWRNHVNYACTLVCTLPILWYRFQTSQKKSLLYICVGVFTMHGRCSRLLSYTST